MSVLETDEECQDVYNSNYRFDNESSTDEDMTDDEGNEGSSDDDDDDFKSRIGKIATRTSQSGKVRIARSKNIEDDPDDKDEFEEDMMREMDERMLQAEKDASIANSSPEEIEMEGEDGDTINSALRAAEETEKTADGNHSASKSLKKTEKDQDKYDDIYFDSDDEDGENKQKNRKVLTNDDLLYDPGMDDEDQSWVDDVRRSYQAPETSHNNKMQPPLKPLPNSDAVLNCPACFVAVCLDCQRHELYKTQYRAMFVMNCSVVTSEVMKLPIKQKKGKKGKGKGGQVVAVTHPHDEYHPVRCDQCKTEIAMYDKDEVYHFFNVVASHS